MFGFFGKIKLSAAAVAKASDCNPFMAVATVMLFYVMFDIFEAGVEALIWGESFHHWLDPIFQLAFMAYSAVVVWECAIARVWKEQKT